MAQQQSKEPLNASMFPSLDSLQAAVSEIRVQIGAKRKADLRSYRDETELSGFIHGLAERSVAKTYVPSEEIKAWLESLIIGAEPLPKSSQPHPHNNADLGRLFKQLLQFTPGLNWYMQTRSGDLLAKVRILNEFGILEAGTPYLVSKASELAKLASSQEAAGEFANSNLRFLLSILIGDSESVKALVAAYLEDQHPHLTQQETWATFNIEDLLEMAALVAEANRKADREKDRELEEQTPDESRIRALVKHLGYLDKVSHCLKESVRKAGLASSVDKQWAILGRPDRFGNHWEESDLAQMAQFALEANPFVRAAFETLTAKRVKDRELQLSTEHQATLEEANDKFARLKHEYDAMEKELVSAQEKLAANDVSDVGVNVRAEQLAARQAVGQVLGFFRFLEEQEPQVSERYVGRIDSLLRGMGIHRIGIPGEIVEFDPKNHEDLGGTAAVGSEVVVNLSGFQSQLENGTENLLKAVVATI